MNSDEDSVANGKISTELSDENGFLSEGSDHEDQFEGNPDLPTVFSMTEELSLVLHNNDNLTNTRNISTSSELAEKSCSLRKIKVHIHCGDIMHPLYKGALVSSHNGSET